METESSVFDQSKFIRSCLEILTCDPRMLWYQAVIDRTCLCLCEQFLLLSASVTWADINQPSSYWADELKIDRNSGARISSRWLRQVENGWVESRVLHGIYQQGCMRSYKMYTTLRTRMCAVGVIWNQINQVKTAEKTKFVIDLSNVMKI